MIPMVVFSVAFFLVSIGSCEGMFIILIQFSAILYVKAPLSCRSGMAVGNLNFTIFTLDALPFVDD